MSAARPPVSAAQVAAADLARFADRWSMACACTPPEVRVERGSLECGACGAPVVQRRRGGR